MLSSDFAGVGGRLAVYWSCGIRYQAGVINHTEHGKKEIYSSRPASSPTGNGDKWRESLQSVFELSLQSQGPERTAQLLEKLADQLRSAPRPSAGLTTPYLNTIPRRSPARLSRRPRVERRIKSIMRWNAMAMVVKANSTTNVGGHISTFASSATLYEVASTIFSAARTADFPGDQIYFQGHAAPGIYARAFLEGRLNETQSAKFPAGTRRRRRAVVLSASVSDAGILAVPDRFDGPRPDLSLYQARFNRYLKARGLINGRGAESLGFLGDGESRRTRIARRDHARRARKSRQSDLGHQLQFAAARRPGARQRKNHPGTRRAFPRRGLERHQSHLGQRLGRHHCARQDRTAAQAHGRMRGRRVSEILSSSRAATRANISSANIPSCSDLSTI